MIDVEKPVWLLDVDGVVNTISPGWGGPPGGSLVWSAADNMSYLLCWAPLLVVTGSTVPFAEQTALYNAINFSFDPISGPSFRFNSTATNTKISAYLCPSDGNAGRIWSIMVSPPDR